MASKASKIKPSTLRASRAIRSGNRPAAGFDPAAKAANILGLRRARGQVSGVERMIESDRSSADIIIQITAAQASMQIVADAVLAQHFKALYHAATRSRPAASDPMYQELIALVSQMSR